MKRSFAHWNDPGHGDIISAHALHCERFYGECNNLPGPNERFYGECNNLPGPN